MYRAIIILLIIAFVGLQSGCTGGGFHLKSDTELEVPNPGPVHEKTLMAGVS